MLQIGLTIGHDASLAIADQRGRILFATGEERFSRHKGHLGSPFLAFQYAKSELGLKNQDFENAVITVGTKFKLEDTWFLELLLHKEHQRNYDIFNAGLPPALLNQMKFLTDRHRFSHKQMVAEAFGFSLENVHFINHHDSHASSAFWPSRFENSAVITLDGSGDGESGSISIMRRDLSKVSYYRIPERYSLGHLYSEVTKRYGFKESKHEGKVTGLASFSQAAKLKNDFYDLLRCKNGRLRFGAKYLLDPRNRDRLEIWKWPNHRRAFHLAVSRVESQLSDFPDLANLIQNYLESIVVDLIEESNILNSVQSISVAGGVFSNVALNKRLRDTFTNVPFYVFPNMGDGGLCVGSIWEHMRLSGRKIDEECVTDMYLGSDLDSVDFNIQRDFIDEHSLAELVVANNIVGVLYGRMEFGPRSLCHRSILASPQDASINLTLNKRLNRTEFMPFAPVVRDIDFDKVFEISSQPNFPEYRRRDFPDNFNFMTETCKVRDFWHSKIPAVVHVDKTARPQILREADNPLVYKTLGCLFEKYKLPVLINTSFNAHEEPIISNEAQALRELRLGRIDVLVSNNKILSF